MKLSSSHPLAILAIALVFVACSGGSGGGNSPTSPLTVQPANIEFTSYELINGSRSDNGVQPELDLREVLSEIAREYSTRMRDEGFFAHADGQGHTVTDRLNAAGVSYRGAAENLAQVIHPSDPAGYAHQLLMDSASHRRNILESTYEVVGVGVARSGDEYWITQIFVNP